MKTPAIGFESEFEFKAYSQNSINVFSYLNTCFRPKKSDFCALDLATHDPNRTLFKENKT